ncbi:MAG: TIGR03943 family protein [Cyanobacteria bacterium P01_A01_bin.45]
MTSSINRKAKKKKIKSLLPWLDVFAVVAWGFLLVYYWLVGKLALLINENYHLLVLGAGICLLIVGISKGLDIFKGRQNIVVDTGHLTLFTPGWGSSLLLATALVGLIVTPSPLTGDKAIQKNAKDLLSSPRILAADRVPPQSFRRNSINWEKLTLVEWVRTLNAYPEPDRYNGKKAKFDGFVMHPPDMGEEYLFLARFIITCCASDAYPVGLPVKIKEGNRQQYPPDTWLEIEGEMITGMVSGKRQVTVAANNIKKIPTPRNPYSNGKK